MSAPPPPLPPADLARRLRRGQALLGLDPGAKTIGLAVGAPETGVATPLKTLKRTRFQDDLALLRRIVDDHAIGGLVIGLPLNMDGSEGPRAQSARALARNLSEALHLPYAFCDERLSTEEAQEKLIEQGIRRDRRKTMIDAMAAAVILQRALDGVAPTA